MVLTLYKLIHDPTIPLVMDKMEVGRSKVHDILHLVCMVICNHLGHLVVWYVGRGLARITREFQAKNWFPNCIGVIDGSHIYINAPPNTIVATDHQNNKSFFILLQEVVDLSATSHLSTPDLRALSMIVQTSSQWNYIGSLKRA